MLPSFRTANRIHVSLPLPLPPFFSLSILVFPLPFSLLLALSPPPSSLSFSPPPSLSPSLWAGVRHRAAAGSAGRARHICGLFLSRDMYSLSRARHGLSLSRHIYSLARDMDAHTPSVGRCTTSGGGRIRRAARTSSSPSRPRCANQRGLDRYVKEYFYLYLHKYLHRPRCAGRCSLDR
jgi:hypothetical protein